MKIFKKKQTLDELYAKVIMDELTGKYNEYKYQLWDIKKLQVVYHFMEHGFSIYCNKYESTFSAEPIVNVQCSLIERIFDYIRGITRKQKIDRAMEKATYKILKENEDIKRTIDRLNLHQMD